MFANAMAEGVTGKANSTVYDFELHNSAASRPAALSLLSLLFAFTLWKLYGIAIPNVCLRILHAPPFFYVFGANKYINVLTVSYI
jgi:hypothetical protein